MTPQEKGLYEIIAIGQRHLRHLYEMGLFDVGSPGTLGAAREARYPSNALHAMKIKLQDGWIPFWKSEMK